MKSRLTLFACLLVTRAVIATSAAAGPSAYQLTKTVSLGAPDRWDYVVFDAASHRVFVAHGDRVAVVDGRDGRLVGEVTGIPGGTHGTAVAAGQGFTDDGNAGEVVIFDLMTFKTSKHIAAAKDADGVIVEPKSGHVFVMDGDPGKVTVIDPKAGSLITNIALGAKPEAGIATGDGRVIVEGADTRELVVIDGQSNKITARWPIPTCTRPHGVAFDAAGHRVFATCVNSQMVAVNTDTGAVVASVPIGKGSDSAAWDPKRRLVFSSNGLDGTISVIQQKTPNDYAPLPPIQTALSARTMAIDPGSGRLYVAALETLPADTAGGRPKPKSGTLRLMFFDPVK